MKYQIRLDDYPFCRPNYPDRKHARDRLITMAQAFRVTGISGLLGVIPAELTEHDIRDLDRILDGTNIKICMHGYTHGFEDIDKTSKNPRDGGEFIDRRISDLLGMHREALLKLTMSERFDPEHFIAPFNAYNQDLLICLHEYGVKYIHTASKEYEENEYRKYFHFDIQPVISVYGKTYASINRIIENMEFGYIPDSQITLHWLFDANENPDWLIKYTRLFYMLGKI